MSHDAQSDQQTRNLSWGSLGSALVILILAFVIWALFFMPPLEEGREEARTAQCRINMKQLGQAFFNYHDTHQRLPSLAANDPLMSWRIPVLTYLDQAPLYARYRTDFAWDSEENMSIATTQVLAYHCPSNPRQQDDQGRQFTAYAIPVWPEGIYAPNAPPPNLASLSDSLSTTILLVEACGQRIVWTEPRDVPIPPAAVTVGKLTEQLTASNSVLSSAHDGFAHVTFADGSVKRIETKTDLKVLSQLLNRADGEPKSF